MKKQAGTHTPPIRPARANTTQGRKKFRPFDAFLALGALIILGVGLAAAGIALQSFMAAGTNEDHGATAILTYSEIQKGAAPQETDEQADESENAATGMPGGYSGERGDVKVALQSNPDTAKIAKGHVKALEGEGYTVDYIAPYPYDHTLVVYRYPELAEEAQHIADAIGASACFRSYTENRSQYDADILVAIGPTLTPAPFA